MKVFSQLVSAQFENRTSDYSAGTGKFWIRTDTSPVVSKFYDGSSVRTIVTTDNTQTLTNKTLTSPAVTGLTGTISSSTDIDLGTASNTSRITVAKNTLANLTALTRKEGTVWYATDTDKLYKDDGTSLTEIGSGSGGAINYIGNPDAESGTTGWSTYDDGAATPVDGTGGTVTTTLTQTSSSPLRGTNSFLITTTAANLLGEGIAYDFTISNADLAKIINISFDYSIASGTYATGDFTVYIIQDPSGTPVVIQPAPYQIQNLTVGLPGKFTATFQTSSTVTTYRLLIHRAVSTSSASTIKLDNFVVGPQTVNYGAPIGDWTSFTPTGTWSSNTTYTGFWRRVGDTMQIEAKAALSGAPSGAFTLNLPSGYSIDTAKITGAISNNKSLGIASLVDSGTGEFTGHVSYESATSVSAYYLIASTTNVQLNSAQVSHTAPYTFANGDAIYLQFQVPIVGWSSSVAFGSDSDTRVVVLRASGNPASASSGNPIIFPTADYDTHGVYNTSTGRYTAPVSGFYRVHGLINSANAGVSVSVYVDAASVIAVATTDSGGECAYTGTVRVNAGQVIDIRPGGTLDAEATSTLHIERISGPSAIAASETVAALYETNTARSITNNSATTGEFLCEDRVFDTHGFVSTSTAIATIPTSGKYRVSASVALASNAGWETGERVQLILYKDGSANRIISTWTAEVNQTNVSNTSGSCLVSCVAGTTLEVRVFQNSDGAISTDTDATANWVSFDRIGN